MKLHNIEITDSKVTLANKINSLATLGFSPYYKFKETSWSRFSDVEKDERLL
jgi:hypothetical protein